MQHVRDLRVSFLVASPDDFWIGEAAVTADKRGFRLTALDSHPATVGPFEYICDHSEGRATFTDGNTTVTVQKHDRRWSISSTSDDLRLFGLDCPLTDEKRFRVQFDYYLSRKRCRTKG